MTERSFLAYETGEVWALDLSPRATTEHSGPALVAPRLAAEFREVYAGSDEITDLPDPAAAMRRIATGRRCFGAWIDGQLGAFGWVSLDGECVGELEREIRLPEGEAYVWDCLTLPAYRRQRLYSALLSHVNATLSHEGLRCIWIGSSKANLPSLRGFSIAGFAPVLKIDYLRLFGLRCTRASGFQEAPSHLIEAARKAFTAKEDRTWGSLAIRYAPSIPLPACAQLELD